MKAHTVLLTSAVGIGLIATANGGNWPSWRGDASGSGRSPEQSLPLEWSRDKNVIWRVDLPDRGNSTPAIWGNRVFVTQAVDEKNLRSLMCFDRANGNLLWQRGVTYKEEERTHGKNPYCSASPAVDGNRIFVSYGSAGVHCYDFEGEELWKRDFGPMDHVWGNSTSPVLYQNLCFHYHGPGKGAFLAALDQKTGKTVWKYEEPDWKPVDRTDGFQGRDDQGVIGTWSTPIIIDADGRDELVMSFPMEIVAFDPLTGEKLWTCEGLNPLVYGSPVSAEGLVVAMGGYHGNTVAVEAGGSGDITASNRLWHEVRHDGGIGTGVIKDGHLFYHNSGGVASCLDLKTGKVVWENRLPGTGKSWGSFVLAGDYIYSLSQAGDTAVIKASPEFEEVGVNPLKEETNSSIAVSNGQIFIRTWKALWCIGGK